MGTNYYLKTITCKCCKSEDNLHIGKASAGWKFSFQAYIGGENEIEISDIRDWIRYLLCSRDGKIVDEYGDEHTLSGLLKMVKARQGLKSHALYMFNNYRDDNNAYLDPWGYEFTEGDFS